MIIQQHINQITNDAMRVQLLKDFSDNAKFRYKTVTSLVKIN